MPHCQFDSDYRISVFSSSFGPEQSADYRVGDSYGKYIFDPTIPQLSLRLLRRYPNPQVGTTLNTFRPAATHQFYVQAFHVLPTTDSRHFVHVRK